MSHPDLPDPRCATPRLTRREREVLELLIHPKRFTAGEISRYLDISTRTVEKHIERLYVKFRVSKRKELRSLANEPSSQTLGQ